MKRNSYSVTVEAQFTIESHTKSEAVRIAKRAVAACPELLVCTWIGNGYREPIDLNEAINPALVDKKLSQGPSADDEEVPF